MHNGAPSVVVRDLVKTFGAFTAVDRVSLEARPGEIFGFLGPNGAGKSTTIRILCGLLRPTSGTATVAGIDVARRPEAVRQQIGYMSQRFSLYNDLRVVENIRFFAGMYSVPAGALPERIAWVLEMAGLKGRESALTGTLATGWKQRLALGCAVLHRPPIVFLDEPTSGVDPISRRQFWELIQAMASDGATVFVTTHYMDEAEYCQRLVLIDAGRVVASGSPSALKREKMTGELLNLECDRLGQALPLLEAHPLVLDAAIFGSSIHIVVASAGESVPALKAYLSDRQIAVFRIGQISPTLEDVFVSLTSRREGPGRAEVSQ
jgi:ABC-2 type transport system ATP-binding protein